jgi:cell division protease FtsH
MICQYGMSDALGPVTYGDSGSDVFIGRDMMSRKDYSEKKAEEIDAEVAALLQGKYDEAKVLLTENRDVLDRIAMALLERETLNTADLDLLLKNIDLPPFEKVLKDTPAPSVTEKPESEPNDGLTGGNVPDPEPMPS